MKKVKVSLPTAFRNICGGKREFEIEGERVGDVIGRLIEGFPALKDKIFDEEGEIYEHIKIYLDGEDINWHKGLETPVEEGARVSIIVAISGG